MKSKMLFVLIIFTVNAVVQAQDFKPYKVKSGKITYEILKYSTVSGYSNHNGVETSYSKQVPHIDQQVVYYWDEYGDIAFEEVYQVSEFGGKLLPEKVKIAERFWVDEHRYYFSFEKNTVSDDPYHLRIKCKQHFQYYQIIGSWIETLYMGTEKSGTKELLGKETDYYRIDNYHDLYAWKGLVLKDESFSTRGSSGPRNTIERAKVAVEIDTISAINKELFNPIWLKRETLYNSLNQQKIVELMDGRQELLIQAENNIDFKIKKNDILLFVTTKLATGKLQVLDIDQNNLTIKYLLYNNNGFELDSRDSYKIKDSSMVNMDNITYKKSEKSEFDFMYKNATIIHKNNISVFLLKPSRSKNLEIPKFYRK
ncbi:hypothetical protein MKD41_10140 [Lutibacter sp. A64]|uniref:hypothetical protein n=1 Tax=Lutibacter sp. A64 TaxID=2918526 RepID=UPI001F050EF0|nr:hypothetical protein [Lutibacter sp. A64]UMB52695.1 hypothetical protein MKD41_10140 [Lutibacter sp. A64]